MVDFSSGIVRLERLEHARFFICLYKERNSRFLLRVLRACNSSITLNALVYMQRINTKETHHMPVNVPKDLQTAAAT